MTEVMQASGVDPTRTMRIDVAEMTAATMPEASRLVLHGLSEPLNQDGPAERSVNEASLASSRGLFAAMLADQHRQQAVPAGQHEIQLPLPIITSGYMTDMYILPKSGFNPLGEGLPAASFLNSASFGRWMNGFIGDPAGWNAGEDWGVWSAVPDVIIPLRLRAPAPVRLILQAPVGDGSPRITGQIAWNGRSETRLIQIDAGQPRLEMLIENLVPDDDGIGRIHLHSDMLVRPCEIDATSPDGRSLGIAVVTVEAAL